MQNITTREAWLNEAVTALALSVFADNDIAVPAMRVSVGWPGGRGNKNSVIGQCWHKDAAADGVAQVFISPVLDDAVRVLDVLVHEMVHAVDENKSGHRGDFRKMALAVGLTGKMTATVAGPELADTLKGIADTLGTYPHAALVGEVGGKKQGTRMLKVVCEDTGYTLRTTAKWLDAYGAPICPCCQRTMSMG